jgi:hypothetical protein
VARGRWARLVRLLVCRHTGLVVFKIAPWSGRCGPSARDGSSAPESGRGKSKALPSAPLGISVIYPASQAAEPRGAREALCRAGCHAAPGGKESFCCEYSEDRCRRNWHRPQCLCRQRGCAWGASDCMAVELLSTQIVRKQAKALFISNDAAHCMQRRRQRFPTVRTVSQVGNSEARAKMTDIRACTSTAM